MLSGCGRCAGAILTEHGNYPSDGSEAALEIAAEKNLGGAWGQSPVFQAWSHVFVVLTAAEDHLRGLETLLAPEVETSFPQISRRTRH